MIKNEFKSMNSVDKMCKNCEVMLLAVSSSNSIDIKEARQKCSRCKNGKNGIYKFDAIYQLIDFKKSVFGEEEEDILKLLQEKDKRIKELEEAEQKRKDNMFGGKRNKSGRGSIIYKRYARTIMQLRIEGYTFKQIEEYLNISHDSVNRIVKRLKAEGFLK